MPGPEPPVYPSPGTFGTGTCPGGNAGKPPVFDIRNFPLRSIRLHDVTIACREFGDGEPLLLICGFGSTMDTWNPPVLEALSARYRVIVFDNRGTGCSGSSDTPFSIRLFADDARQLMDGLGIERAHVLGHSMGSFIAQELALNHPARIRKMILVSGGCGGTEAIPMSGEVFGILTDKSGTLTEQAFRMFTILFPNKFLGQNPDPFSYCPEVYETTPEETTARQAEAIGSWEGTCNRLHEIRVPALVITGAEDVVVPPENSMILGRKIAGSRVIRMPGAGHGLMYQYPEEFAKTVITFLESSC